jgi:hypothetical protein
MTNKMENINSINSNDNIVPGNEQPFNDNIVPGNEQPLNDNMVPQLISCAYDFSNNCPEEYVEYPQLICSVYKLENGIVYKWTRESLYDDYQLHIVHAVGHGGCGCGNPWNIINDYRDELLTTRPDSKKIFEQKSGMHHEILSSQDLRDRMIDGLGSDIWCVYTITQDRKKIIKTYFDARAERSNPERTATRERLIEDPHELIEDIDGGYTVVFVFGSSEFIEQYFIGIPGTLNTMMIEVTHYD